MSMFEGPRLKIYNTRLDYELNQPGGMVGDHLSRIGRKIQISAKSMVGFRTGKLKRSINVKHERRGRFQHIVVGSKVHYALAHHEGTRPHEIPTPDGRMLRFNIGGQVVYTRKTVKHPGTKPNPYLTIPMRRHVR